MQRCLGALVLLAGASAACACALVAGERDRVSIESEEAIIIWDAASRTQHFIRRASFTAATKDFGFLVPTPSQPELAEADDAAFDYLARLTRPPQFVAVASAEKEALAGTVKVLERKKVSGFDAAVLEAGDPRALDRWLKANGYVSTPALVEWYGPYVASGWKITAFKIDPEGGRAAPGPVRMSFRADAPFFPYREPPGEARDRLLRVHFIAEGRHEAALAADRPWPGTAVWSNPLSAENRGALHGLLRLPGAPLGEASWLTVLEDRSSRRPPGGDLRFIRSSVQSPLGFKGDAGGAGGSWWMFVLAALALIALAIGHFWRSARKQDG
jgi:hypothetical protein